MARPVQEIKLGEGPGARKFWVRSDSPGDAGAVQKIFGEQEYRLDGLPQSPAALAYYFSLVESGRKPLIVDAGANIGAASVYFSLKFPQARIYAIEPEKGNAELLRKNCKGLDVRVFEAGLGSEDGEASIQDPGRSDWAFRLGDHGLYQVPVMSAGSLMDEAAKEDLAPYILKVDIEGSERELFSADTAWLKQFAVIVIELHDWLFPFESSSSTFLRAVADNGFDLLGGGENFFCFNGALLRPFLNPQPQ